MVYWTFPNDIVFTNNTTTSKFPTRVLILNYLDGSYSFFNDSLTCFGQFQTFRDIRWVDLPIQWQNYQEKWNSGSLQQDYPVIVTGNQQGYVFFYNQDQNQSPVNDPSLSIKAASQALICEIEAKNHNLQVDQFIQISGVNGMVELNSNVDSPNGIYQVLAVTGADTFTISYYNITLDNFFPVDSTTFTVYTNGGQITVLNNFNVTSKQFIPFEEQGLQGRLTYLDIYTEGAANGEFSVNYFINQNPNTSVTTNVSVPKTITGQQRMWFRTIPNVTGQYIQFQMRLSNAQMNDSTLFDFDFTLHSVAMHFQPASRFMIGKQL